MSDAAVMEPEQEELEPLRYAYSEIERAPALHRQILRGALYDFPHDKIAAAVGTTVAVVDKVLSHPPIKRQLDHIQEIRKIKFAELFELFEDGMETCVRRMVDMVKDKKTSGMTLVKSAEYFSDRHPNGVFVKQTKRKEVRRVEVFASEEVTELKQLAHDQGVRFTQIEDAEFRQIENKESHDATRKPD